MKVYGMMAICTFPLWRKAFDSLVSLCDGVVVRFDAINGDPEILQELLRLQKQPESRILEVQLRREGWSCPQWREDCLRMLDDYKPDIVLCPDEDEVFDEGILEELKAFHASDKKGMMFMYHPLESNDGREINKGMPYPPEAHMKAFKWEPLLCYYPYHGAAVLARYHDPKWHWQAKTKIRHYSAYTKAMEHGKKWRSNTPGVRHAKSVTLVGFGPSGANVDAIGEVWSLNNCYDSFPENLMQHVTRIYEMHMEHKRNREIAKDGNMHFWHLDQLGKLGHRIVMQNALPQITGSEMYPLQDIIKRFGLAYFHGTPTLMLAHAIYDGYTHIRCFGFDQMDFEHRKQRECFAYWVGMAMGMGIQMSGAFTFFEEDKRIYGYDYGPEWDEESNRILWNAFPFEMRMKFPSRAMSGKLFIRDSEWKT